MVEVMNIPLSKGPMHALPNQCPQPCSRPPQTHASTRDSWTLTGKSGSVSCGVTSPFSWILVHTRFCLKEVNGNHLQEGLCHIQIWCTQNLCPCGRPLVTRTSTGDTQTLKGSSGSDSVGSPGVRKFGLSPPSISGRYGV